MNERKLKFIYQPFSYVLCRKDYLLLRPAVFRPLLAEEGFGFIEKITTACYLVTHIVFEVIFCQYPKWNFENYSFLLVEEKIIDLRLKSRTTEQR